MKYCPACLEEKEGTFCSDCSSQLIDTDNASSSDEKIKAINIIIDKTPTICGACSHADYLSNKLPSNSAREDINQDLKNCQCKRSAQVALIKIKSIIKN